jgi:hypothetical protein
MDRVHSANELNEPDIEPLSITELRPKEEYMSKLVPYAVHYMFDGVRQHFFKLAEQFSDVEAIHSASAHAYPDSDLQIAAHANLETARIKAQQLGITHIRWNEAI